MMKFLSILLILFVFLFNGCEKNQENKIQPTKELDLGNLKQSDNSIYKHYFRRAFVFDSHSKILRFQKKS